MVRGVEEEAEEVEEDGSGPRCCRTALEVVDWSNDLDERMSRM